MDRSILPAQLPVGFADQAQQLSDSFTSQARVFSDGASKQFGSTADAIDGYRKHISPIQGFVLLCIAAALCGTAWWGYRFAVQPNKKSQ